MNNDNLENNNNLDETQVIEISEPNNVDNPPAHDNSVKVENTGVEVAPVEEIPIVEVNDIPQEVASVVETPTEVPQAPSQNTGTTVPETNNVKNDFVDKERKKWPIVLLLLMVVFGGLFGYYYFIMTKPINVIDKVLSNFYGEVKKLATDGNDELNLNSFIFDSSLNITSDAEELADYSGLNAKLYLAYDLKDNTKNKAEVNLSVKDEKMLDLAVSIIGNKIYLDLKDKFPKVVYTETDEVSSILDSVSIDKDKANKKVSDYLYLLKTVKETIVKNISEEKLNKKILLKDIDGKKIPAVEVTYKIDYPEYKKLHTAIYDALINDERIFKLLLDDSETTEDELKKDLTEERDNISELDLDGDINVTLDIDAFTSKLVSAEIKDNGSKIIMRENSTEANIDIESKEDGTISVTVDKKEGKVFMDMKLISEEEVERFAITLKFKEATSTTYDIDATLVMYDKKDINKEYATLAGEFKLDLNKTIVTVDTTNAASMESLSESERNQLSNALEGIYGLFSLGSE